MEATAQIRQHNPVHFKSTTDSKRRTKATLTSYVSVLYIVYKCGRDSFALAVMMMMAISPSSPVMMISVRAARILLCVGCDSPEICVGQAPVSPLGRQRTSKTPTPDRKQHPSAETTRLSLNQADNDIFGGMHIMCLQGLPPQSHQGLHVPDNKKRFTHRELSRC